METIGPKKWGSVFLGEERRLFLVNPVVSSDSQIHKMVYRNTPVLVSISSSQGTRNLVLELISYKNIKQIVFKQLRDCIEIQHKVQTITMAHCYHGDNHLYEARSELQETKKKIEPVGLKVENKPRTLET